jgi:hypothetical protein
VHWGGADAVLGSCPMQWIPLDLVLRFGSSASALPLFFRCGCVALSFRALVCRGVVSH